MSPPRFTPAIANAMEAARPMPTKHRLGSDRKTVVAEYEPISTTIRTAIASVEWPVGTKGV
jgi:hypothetical protein